MRREVPGVLWVGLIALGAITVIQFLLGLAQMNPILLIAVAINVLMLIGLYHGYRWAFVVTLVFAVLGVLVTLARSPVLGLGTLVLNGLVVVPMLLARDYFWGPRLAADDEGSRYCHRCGHDLTGVVEPLCPNCSAEIRTPDRGPAGFNHQTDP